MSDDELRLVEKRPIDRVNGGKVEKGQGGQRDGFKPTAPSDLSLPKPVPAPPAGPKKG